MFKERRIFPAGLVLITIIAALIRVSGISWGLPQEFHPDEPLVVPRAIEAITHGDWNPHYFLVPSLQTHLTSIAYGAVYLRGRCTGQFKNRADFGKWAAWNYGTLYMVGRGLSVIFGLLTVIGVVALTREILPGARDENGGGILPDLAALLSGLIVALSPLITASSRLITPDIPMLAFFIWALWALISGVNNCSRGRIILGAFLCGLAISSKYSAAILIVPLVISLFLFRVDDAGNRHRMPVLGSIFALIGGFLLGTPYALLDMNTFLSHLAIQYSAQHKGHIGMEGGGLTIYQWSRDLIANEGYGLVILALPGVVILLVKSWKAWWLIIPLLLLYLMELSRWTVYADRYLLPAIAILAILAPMTWLGITNEIRNSVIKWVVAIVMIAWIIAPPAIINAWMTSRLDLPDTRTLALHWIEEKIPAGSRVLWEIGGPQPADANREFHREPAYDVVTLTPWFSDTSKGEDPSVVLLNANPEYIITSSNYRSRYEDSYTREKYPDVVKAWDRYYSGLGNHAVVVYHVKPGKYTGNEEIVGPEITIYKRKN